LESRDDIAFVFVGGGSEQIKVKEFARTKGLTNIRCLPYQPQEELSAVLSAADLHLVVMGQAFAGIIHPSKIYNILAVGSPFVYIGPKMSHVAEIIANLPDAQASAIEHGQVNQAVDLIRRRADAAQTDGKRWSGDHESSTGALAQFINQIELTATEAVEAESRKLQSAL
jgi:putative colanic acid biosynthesis glycosyltransferase WcaI